MDLIGLSRMKRARRGDVVAQKGRCEGEGVEKGRRGREGEGATRQRRIDVLHLGTVRCPQLERPFQEYFWKMLLTY